MAASCFSLISFVIASMVAFPFAIKLQGVAELYISSNTFINSAETYVRFA